MGDQEPLPGSDDASAQVVVLVPADAVARCRIRPVLRRRSRRTARQKPTRRSALRESGPGAPGPRCGRIVAWPGTSPGRYEAPSATWGPETKFDRGPVAPTVASVSKGTTSGSSHRPDRTVSLFRKTSIGVPGHGRPVVASTGETMILAVRHHLDPGITAQPRRRGVPASRCPPQRPDRVRRGSVPGHRGRPGSTPRHSRRG